MDPVLLLRVKAEAERRGYWFEETEEDGQLVVRMFRPDGSVAVTARRPKPPVDTQPV